MTLFIYLIIIYFGVRISQQLSGIYQSINFLKTKNRYISDSYQNKITVLIPIFCEEHSLKGAIKFWSKSGISPIFVTTEKENFSKNCKSIEILNKTNFQIIHFPKTDGFKASQLNYAISQIKSDGYIAIFDVDSRPDLEVFEYVEKLAIDEVLQMPTLFTEDFNKNSIYGKSSAIFQSRRVLTFEIPTLLKNKFGYLVGHGLFIKNKVFDKYHFCEETVTEDLVFGYELYLAGVRPKPLPYFDFSTVPSSFLQTISQTSRWFAGDLIFIKYLKIGKKDILHILRRYLHILEWLFGSITIIFGLLFGDITQIIILIFLISTYIYIHFVTLKILNIRNNINIYFGIIFKMITNSIPPIYGVYRIMLDILNIKKHIFERTEK